MGTVEQDIDRGRQQEGAGDAMGRHDVEELVGVEALVHDEGACISRLVELGLTVKAAARHVSKPGRLLRAQELAGQAIAGRSTKGDGK
jgi:hypothetical protein